ncbi:MAG: hypothetical protein II262_04410 [Alistipes sp.]|nr:hypothetical protein [Alistipes sp.]
MVVDVINEYLKSNRRLVIPSFGAFVTKEDGQIIFSELLKKDDGILRGLLVAKGMREIEAAGKIDRFVFEIRHALMQVGACPVADFGTFYRTAEGVVTFDATKPILEPIPAVAEPAADVVPAAVTPTPTPTPAPAPAAMGGPSSTPTSRRPRRKSTGGGFAMIVAIIAIVAALAALAYGIYTMVTVPNDNLDQQMDALRIPKIDVPKY